MLQLQVLRQDPDEAKKKEVAGLKSSLQPITELLNATEKKLQDELVKLPNLPADQVPAGRTPAENTVVREGGNKPTLMAGAVPHWDLIRKYDIVDFEKGAKISG